MILSPNMESIILDVFLELRRADEKYEHDPMSSAEIGLATIKCELAELEREVIRPARHNGWMRKEAVQVAAMSLKFLRDICDNKVNGGGR